MPANAGIARRFQADTFGPAWLRSAFAMSMNLGGIEKAISEHYGVDGGLPGMDPIRKFVVLILWQAQRDRATELVIGNSLPEGAVPIQIKVEGAWYEMTPFPQHIRPQVMQTLTVMAGQGHEVVFPLEAAIDEEVTPKLHIQWHVSVASAGAPIHFRRS